MAEENEGGDEKKVLLTHSPSFPPSFITGKCPPSVVVAPDKEKGRVAEECAAQEIGKGACIYDDHTMGREGVPKNQT